MSLFRVLRWVMSSLLLGIALVAAGFGFYYATQAGKLAKSPAPTFAPVQAAAGEKSSTAARPQQSSSYYHNPNSSVESDVLR